MAVGGGGTGGNGGGGGGGRQARLPPSTDLRIGVGASDGERAGARRGAATAVASPGPRRVGGCVVAAVATHPTPAPSAASRKKNALASLPTQRREGGGERGAGVAPNEEARARVGGAVAKPTALLITSVQRLHSAPAPRRSPRETHWTLNVAQTEARACAWKRARGGPAEHGLLLPPTSRLPHLRFSAPACGRP